MQIQCKISNYLFFHCAQHDCLLALIIERERKTRANAFTLFSKKNYYLNSNDHLKRVLLSALWLAPIPQKY